MRCKAARGRSGYGSADRRALRILPREQDLASLVGRLQALRGVDGRSLSQLSLRLLVQTFLSAPPDAASCPTVRPKSFAGHVSRSALACPAPVASKRWRPEEAPFFVSFLTRLELRNGLTGARRPDNRARPW
jgi:hypothetical protein